MPGVGLEPSFFTGVGSGGGWSLPFSLALAREEAGAFPFHWRWLGGRLEPSFFTGVGSGEGWSLPFSLALARGEGWSLPFSLALARGKAGAFPFHWRWLGGKAGASLSPRRSRGWGRGFVLHHGGFGEGPSLLPGPPWSWARGWRPRTARDPSGAPRRRLGVAIPRGLSGAFGWRSTAAAPAVRTCVDLDRRRRAEDGCRRPLALRPVGWAAGHCPSCFGAPRRQGAGRAPPERNAPSPFAAASFTSGQKSCEYMLRGAARS